MKKATPLRLVSNVNTHAVNIGQAVDIGQIERDAFLILRIERLHETIRERCEAALEFLRNRASATPSDRD